MSFDDIDALRAELDEAQARLAKLDERPPRVDARAIVEDPRACAHALSVWVIFANDHPEDPAARETASFVAGVAAGFLLREAERVEKTATVTT